MPKKLGGTASKVLEVISAHWPTNASEIGRILEPKRRGRSINAKYTFHIKRLKNAGLISSRKIGDSVVVWFSTVDKIKEKLEKLKTVRQIIDNL